MRFLESASLARRRAVRRLWLAGTAGLAFGAGLSIWANVSGVVLAAYGAGLAVLLVAGIAAARRATERPHERQP